MRLVLALSLSLPAMSACSKKDPLYCDENTPCTDPELPFCDDEGAYPASDGIKHTCIPDPFGSETDGGQGDAQVGRSVVQLEVGRFATCAVLSDGGLRCWGNVRYGELIGDNEDPRDAGDVETGGAIAEAAIGFAHLCVLYEDGNVRCWGENDYGILGYGHQNPVDGPPAELPDIELGGPARHITAGENHTCALLESGDVRCWGYNSVSQLGLGKTEMAVGDNEVPTDEDPVDVGGVVEQLVAGNAHTCVVLEGGYLRCWGQNAPYGKLGYGNESEVGDTETPSEAGYVNVGGNVSAVAPGESHTCALLEGGAVRCWGYHVSLGIPGNEDDIGDDEEPTMVGTTDVGGPVRQIVAGDAYTCVVREDDEVVCWGGPTHGKLGYGTAEIIGDNETPAETGPVMIGGTAAQLSTGCGDRSHSCVLLQSGDVRCWGANDLGQLGLRHLEDVGDDETPASRDPVQILD